jgi:N-ethylmaleimide reductase
LNAVYYAQRASAALIISEATQVSQQGQGYAWTPGIHTREQVQGWRLVTNAIHQAGGTIFLQLWHVGRISHPSFQPDGMLPVAPSAIKPSGEAFVELENGQGGLKPFVTPRAIATEEMPYLIEQFVRGSKNARTAGFDGVEIHSANGYLLDQFINSVSNKREDRYGGTIENRSRLTLEVVEAVAGVWGASRVGVRLSPLGTFNDMGDDTPEQTFGYLAEKLGQMGLAYLHVVRPTVSGNEDVETIDERAGQVLETMRRKYSGTLIL